MANTTDVLTEMANTTDVLTEMTNATDVLTDVFTEMTNTTDVLREMANTTDVPKEIGNVTDLFMDMDNVSDIMNSIAQVMSVTLICMSVAIILMNIFVIVIILIHKWMRSNANIIICSMAITDLLGGLITIAVGVVKWTDWFLVPSLVCRLLDTVDSWIAMASLAHVLAVNVERYLAIVFPLKKKNILSAARIKIILLGIWVVTFVEAVLYTIDTVLGDRCAKVGMRYLGLAVGLVLLGVALPVLTVVIIYIHSVVVIVRKLHFMAKSSNRDENALARSQRKMMGTVSAILAEWIICWGPLMSIFLIRTIAYLFQTEIDIMQFFMMLFIFKLLTYFDALLNPILYFLTSHDFRKAGNDLCKCMSHQ